MLVSVLKKIRIKRRAMYGVDSLELQANNNTPEGGKVTWRRQGKGVRLTKERGGTASEGEGGERRRGQHGKERGGEVAKEQEDHERKRARGRGQHERTIRPPKQRGRWASCVAWWG